MAILPEFELIHPSSSTHPDFSFLAIKILIQRFLESSDSKLDPAHQKRIRISPLSSPQSDPPFSPPLENYDSITLFESQSISYYIASKKTKKLCLPNNDVSFFQFIFIQFFGRLQIRLCQMTT